MTTFNMTGGFVVTWPDLSSEDPEFRGAYSLLLVTDNPDGTLYRHLPAADPDFPLQLDDGTLSASLRFAGTGFEPEWPTTRVTTITWDGGTKSTTVLTGSNISDISAFYIPLQGDALPAITSDAAAKSFLQSLSLQQSTVFSLKFSDLDAQVSENDLFFGEGDDDAFDFGTGDDRGYGRAGDDSLAGGAGNDRLFGALGEDVLTGGADDDLLNGGQDADTLEGGTGNDRLVGGGGNDTLEGGAGDDDLFGGNGNDRLFAGTGTDTLFGGQGRDELTDGPGSSVLRGQNGNDTFYLDGFDRAEDFIFGGAGRDTAYIDLYELSGATLVGNRFTLLGTNGQNDTFIGIEIFDVAGFKYTTQDLYDALLLTL
jgi:Ca2+-binding RTX toxin-like protein